MKLSARATVIWSFNCVWRMCLQLTWLLAEGLSSSMAFGGRPLVLHHMHLSRGLLMFCMIWQLATCRISDPGKRAREHFNSLYDSVGSHMSSVLPLYQPLTHISAKLFFLTLSYNLLPGTIPEFQTLAVYRIISAHR